MPRRHKIQGSVLLQHMALPCSSQSQIHCFSEVLVSASPCSANSHPTFFYKGAKTDNKDQNPRPAKSGRWQNSQLPYLQRPKLSATLFAEIQICRFPPNRLRLYCWALHFDHYLLPPSTAQPKGWMDNYHLESLNVTSNVLGRREGRGNEVGGNWGEWQSPCQKDQNHEDID